MVGRAFEPSGNQNLGHRARTAYTFCTATYTCRRQERFHGQGTARRPYGPCKNASTPRWRDPGTITCTREPTAGTRNQRCRQYSAVRHRERGGRVDATKAGMNTGTGRDRDTPVARFATTTSAGRVVGGHHRQTCGGRAGPRHPEGLRVHGQQGQVRAETGCTGARATGSCNLTGTWWRFGRMRRTSSSTAAAAAWGRTSSPPTGGERASVLGSVTCDVIVKVHGSRRSQG